MKSSLIGPIGPSRSKSVAMVAAAALIAWSLTAGVAIAAPLAGNGVLGQRQVRRSTCSDSTYEHIWVTVSAVQAHKVPGGWTDLTPGLAMAPMQVDLLDADSADCFLASLGYTSGLPVGRYQQIRIILWDNVGPGRNGNHGGGKGKGKGKGGGGGSSVTPPAVNACAAVGTYDCVQLADGSVEPLFVNAETHTGLRIPPGQIARGGLKITPGELLDLDLDFDACQSVVEAGHSGKYLLKPALMSGEASTNPLLNGTVVVGTVNGDTVSPVTTSPVAGANVYLESQVPTNDVTIYPGTTPPNAQVENLIDTTTTFADGGFAFCAPAVGTYEIVTDSAAMPNTSDASNATITTDVTVPTPDDGYSAGVIPLVNDDTPPALLESMFTTQGTTPPGAGDLITFGATQPFTGDANATVQAIVPPLSGTMPALMNDDTPLPIVPTGASPNTADCPNLTSPTCPANTNCACFTLALPNSNPVIGPADGGPYNVPAANPAAYSVVGAASNLSGDGTAECDPSALITNPTTAIALTTSPMLVSTPLLEFTGCD